MLHEHLGQICLQAFVSSHFTISNACWLCGVVLEADKDNSQRRNKSSLLPLLRESRIRFATVTPDRLLKAYFWGRRRNGKSRIGIIFRRIVPHAARCASLFIDINRGEVFLCFEISAYCAQPNVTMRYSIHTYFAVATPAGPILGGWRVFKVHYYVHAYHHR